MAVYNQLLDFGDWDHRRSAVTSQSATWTASSGWDTSMSDACAFPPTSLTRALRLRARVESMTSRTNRSLRERRIHHGVPVGSMPSIVSIDNDPGESAT